MTQAPARDAPAAAPDVGCTLLYAGIDEAGYGPTLGPLCVAMTVFEVRGWTPGEAAPDLWRYLSKAVCRQPSRSASRRRIAVNDSKALKLSNGLKTLHPLVHLERAVLAFCHAAGDRPEHDAALFDRLGARAADLPWYAAGPIPLPISADAELQRLTGLRLAADAAKAGVSICDLRCLTVCEDHFNSRLTELGSKAAVSFEAVALLIRRVWRSTAALQFAEHAGPRIVVDRQGGRTCYAGVLRAALPDAEVVVLSESEEASRYELVGTGDSAGRRARITFQVEAESAHLPVALASMVAKYVRELLMARFNRYWSGRISEIKPTAGYSQDARRWLRDAWPHLSPDERRTLPRRA